MMGKAMAGEDLEQFYSLMRKQERPSLSFNNGHTFIHFDMYDLFDNLSYVYIKIPRRPD